MYLGLKHSPRELEWESGFRILLLLSFFQQKLTFSHVQVFPALVFLSVNGCQQEFYR